VGKSVLWHFFDKRELETVDEMKCEELVDGERNVNNVIICSVESIKRPNT
jgi:hypothetical protein